jgi:hypothetical protein
MSLWVKGSAAPQNQAIIFIISSAVTVLERGCALDYEDHVWRSWSKVYLHRDRRSITLQALFMQFVLKSPNMNGLESCRGRRQPSS